MKRIKVYPPAGGEPVEVYQDDADRLINNGWSVVPGPAELADQPAKAEGNTNGNTQGKQRNRKGR
jgi:hypothetical protein